MRDVGFQMQAPTAESGAQCRWKVCTYVVSILRDAEQEDDDEVQRRLLAWPRRNSTINQDSESDFGTKHLDF